MLKLVTFSLLIFFSTELFPQNIIQNPLAIDFGLFESSVKSFFIKQTKESLYTPDLGFGLVKVSNGDFINDRMRQKTVRDEMTYDGIADNEIEFKVNLTKGNWYLTFWVDAGYEDSPSTKLFINGNEIAITWHQLNPPAEGRTSPINAYRVIHTKITIDKNQTIIKWTNKKEPVQLCGLTLIPEVDVMNLADDNLNKILANAGKYKSSVKLVDIEKMLLTKLKENQQNAFCFYWYQQISLLNEAERLIEMEGWEWGKEITSLSIFGRREQALILLDAHIENFHSSNYLLLERALWLRGKASYDLVLENNPPYQKILALRDLKKLLELYPEDETLRMLNGERIFSNAYFNYNVKNKKIPRWAILQHEAINRLADEIDWWVKIKQAPNGELGGKYGDDVEILREWIPMLIFGDSITITGWKKLADAVWFGPEIYKGYSKDVYDVEHSSEFISDSTPELLLIDTDSTYFKRLVYTADHFENLWTAKNLFGSRFFKSAWFSSTEVDERPPRNRDVDYNARAVKPLRFLAWYSQNPKYSSLLKEWADSWVDVALRTDKGKPKGIIPPSIQFPDGQINGSENDWYQANMFWDYYNWTHSCGSMILDQLLFTYTLTKDKKLLLPLELHLSLIKKYLAPGSNFLNNKFPIGSEEWAVQQIIGKKEFWNVVQNWRVITNNPTYDDIILKYATNYVQYLISGDERNVEEGLYSLLEILRYNRPLRTNLVLHTDRVRIPGTELLKALISGDGSSEGASPYQAVSWDKTNRDITILVKRFFTNFLEIDFYNFGKDAKEIVARLWQLENGSYRVILQGEEMIIQSKIIDISKPGERIELNILPAQLIHLKIEKIK